VQRIFAIAWLTWKAAVRFKLFLVIAALLILSVVGLPLVIKDDGSAQGFTQIILTYTLSTITALLGLSTLWLSCGTLARDIEECQIQVVATKPVARWQIWLGKWLGIVSLNAALLTISGTCVFTLLEWRASHLPADVRQTLQEQVLVSRGSAKEASHMADIETATDRALRDKLKNTAIESQADILELRKQIKESLLGVTQQVPPSYERVWKIDLGLARNSLAGKPLQLRIKFNTPMPGSMATFGAAWQIGDPPKTKLWQTNMESLAAETFHEFVIPPDLFDENGVLTIAFFNPNDTALLFPPDEGMEVLYPQGSFGLNFVRGLGIIFCWMALLAALGLAAASALSFPVAAFFALAMMLVVLSSGTLADSVESGTVAGGNAETGRMNHSVMDVVLIPAFKGVLTVISLAKNFSPIDALSTGRCVTWTELGLAFAQIVVVLGGLFAAVGISCSRAVNWPRRRERNKLTP
jgi:hypothetical protein